MSVRAAWKPDSLWIRTFLGISFIFFAIWVEGAKDEKALWKSVLGNISAESGREFARLTFYQQCYTFKHIAKKESLDKNGLTVREPYLKWLYRFIVQNLGPFLFYILVVVAFSRFTSL